MTRRAKPRATDSAALAAARAAALPVVEKLIGIVSKPRRNAKSQVDAAKLILAVAGVGALDEDERRAELLRRLRGKISKEAYAEVVGALTDDAGLPEDGTPAAGSGADRAEV
ncbi:MAG TPA: hypothetical protein VK509_14755 [Polyangiales bacterium]|nr:hypothetical protein [Polyangiales bacterium]